MEIEVASTPLRRLRGLVGRRPAAGQALHLPGTRSVHTFGVRGRIDLVWVDAAGTVVRIDRSVRPCRVRTCMRAASVVECGAGEWQSVVARL